MAAVAVICGRNNGLTQGPKGLGTGHGHFFLRIGSDCMPCCTQLAGWVP
jgi:hypothetical protein